MKTEKSKDKIRVSFDLDETLFVDPQTYKTETRPMFPFNIIFKERLRLGTVRLIHELQKEGFEVWVYTSSFRSEQYIKLLFLYYNVKFNGIINATRHQKEVQSGHKEILPQKMPNKYHISLHIDDEEVICSYGREYGFDTYNLNKEDDKWVEKILLAARKSKEKRFKR